MRTGPISLIITTLAIGPIDEPRYCLSKNKRWFYIGKKLSNEADKWPVFFGLEYQNKTWQWFPRDKYYQIK